MTTLKSDTPGAAPPPRRRYAEEVLSQRLERMLSHSEGVRQGDVEAVHQMRVWSRRTRAALEIFDSCFSGKEFAQIEREVKTMADALGQARDLDVMIESLTKRTESLPEEQRPGVLAFVESLQRQREACQEPVAKAVHRLERHDLAAWVARLTATEEPGRESDEAPTARREMRRTETLERGTHG